MKKTLLLVGLALSQFIFAQTPVYHHSFEGSLEASGFTVATTGNSLTSDMNDSASSALAMAAGHGAITLNIANHKTELMQEGTISMWYKHGGTGTSAFGANKPLFYWSNGNSSYSEALMLGIGDFGKLRITSFKTQYVGANVETQFLLPNTDSNQWNHYTVSYKFKVGEESGHIKVYVNGALLFEGQLSFDLPANTTSTIVFAGFNNSHSSSLYGAMDEIRVFTESLSNEQIVDLFLNDLDNFTIPEPVIVHEFSNEFYKENFDLGEYTHLTNSKHNTVANALNAPINHSGISVDLEGHKNELAQAGTISFWYKHSGMTQTNIPGLKPLFNLQDANGDGNFRLGCGYNDNAYRYQVFASSTGTGSNGAWTANISYAFPTNQWHQYTVVYQTGAGGYADFYLDGQKILRFDAIEFNYAPEDLGKIYFLGKDPSFINYMYGAIDGIRIYDHALSPLQVAYLFGIVDQEEAYYPFVEYKLDNNTYDTNRVFNPQHGAGTLFGENISGDENAAGYFNTEASLETRLEVSKDFNQYVNGNMTTGFGFKLMDVPSSNNLNNFTIPLFTSSSIYYDANRVSLSVDRSTMKLQLKHRHGTEVIDYTVNFNTWYYAHIVIQEDTANVYINGGLIHSFTSEEAFGNLSNGRGLYFGRSNDYSSANGNWSTLVGAMDEIFVEAVAYDIDEILSNVQAFDPEGVLSIITNDATVELQVYPNPTQGLINFTETVNVEVFDMQGRKVVNFKNVSSIDLSNQNTGMYFLKVSNDTGIKVVKVIKK